jgi:Transposase, Mutator family
LPLAHCKHHAAKEDKEGWSAFLKHLKERGLKGVRLITSDACIGLAESAAEFFLEAAWQRCVVHWYRNIFSHVPSTKEHGFRVDMLADRASPARRAPAAGAYREGVMELGSEDRDLVHLERLRRPSAARSKLRSSI